MTKESRGVPITHIDWSTDPPDIGVHIILFEEPEPPAEFPEDPEDCEHGVWNPDNRQCLDCGDISPEDRRPL